MSGQTFWLYVATWGLVALTPGPAVMYSMAQATRRGFRASLTGIAGIQTGNLVFFGASAGGLAALLSSANTAFTLLRAVGAAYLFYLGLRIIVQSFQSRGVAGEERPGLAAGPAVFTQGLLLQITNPKALLFVSALLPQFLDPARPVLPQLAILAAATIVVDFGVLSSYAYGAERSARSFRRLRFARSLERAFGAALILFGAKLLFSRR